MAIGPGTEYASFGKNAVACAMTDIKDAHKRCRYRLHRQTGSSKRSRHVSHCTAGALLLSVQRKPPTAAPQQQIFKEQKPRWQKPKASRKTVQDGADAQKTNRSTLKPANRLLSPDSAATGFS